MVSGVALSGDGKYALTGSNDNTAILWQAAGGKKLQTFPGSIGGVTSVALSGDGKYAVTGLWRLFGEKHGASVLWDAPSGEELQTFKGHAGPVMSVALSGNGKHVVTGSSDMTAILWQAADGKKLQTFTGHTHHVTGVALSGDGMQVWTAAHDGTTRLWDPATGKERCRLYSIDAGKDWLVVTPEGLFDGSPGAWRFVTYRVPSTPKLADDDATRKKFHRPGLLAQIWKETT